VDAVDEVDVVDGDVSSTGEPPSLASVRGDVVEAYSDSDGLSIG
jgi:hypothetical protein